MADPNCDVAPLGGRAQTHPSTLHMDGTSPVTVHVRATTERLRDLHRQQVYLLVEGEVPPWMEFAGCYDEPTKATVSYEDEWRSDAARPLYVARRSEEAHRG